MMRSDGHRILSPSGISHPARGLVQRKESHVVSYTRPALLTRPTVEVPQQPLLIVSNRGPVEFYHDATGRLRRRQARGGVASALTSVANSAPVSWIATAAGEADREVALAGGPLDVGDGTQLRLVAPPREAYDLYYGTFCNPMLWFLQHSMWDRLERPDARSEALYAWEHGYLPVNQAIAEVVAGEFRSGRNCGSVMLHDYHLYAAPLFIRNLCPGVALQHFIHIPWPGLEAWQDLPRQIVDSIFEGLLANDSVVFQTEKWAQDFLLTCWAFFPSARIDFTDGVVTYRGRRTKVSVNPISVDVFDLRSQLSSPEAQPYFASLAAETAEKTIVRVDRLDPSKNIDAGLRAFDRLLQSHPEWAGRVRMLSFLVPSRGSIPEYRSYADEVFPLADEINARHGTKNWKPIKLFYEHNRLQALVALSLYDVLMVNPLIDGMNLVSKEGPVLNRRDGALVLSEAAGSFEELRGGAIGVAPEDIEGTANALHTALTLPEVERRERAALLRRAVLKHDIGRWLQVQLEDLASIDDTKPAPAAA
ncbi:MAG: trehalose-6-phosphate synthase [Dehalococcoidia bacterium]|jgi:trehalose 6-phosphate synthase